MTSLAVFACTFICCMWSGNANRVISLSEVSQGTRKDASAWTPMEEKLHLVAINFNYLQKSDMQIDYTFGVAAGVALKWGEDENIAHMTSSSKQHTKSSTCRLTRLRRFFRCPNSRFLFSLSFHSSLTEFLCSGLRILIHKKYFFPSTRRTWR